MKRFFLVIMALICFCFLCENIAYAYGYNEENKCDGVLGKVLNECAEKTIDTDTHAKRETWGGGIKDELELCGTEEDSTPCPTHIDEVRIDSEWDFVRQEGKSMIAVKHKAKDLPNVFKKLLSTLWPPNWFK